MAACGARAAGRADAAHRRAHGCDADDPETQARIPAFLGALINWAGATAATCGSNALGHERCRTFAECGRIGRGHTGRYPCCCRLLNVAPLLQATRTVPIVFVIVPDPVGSGFIKSLARPGGNATGFTSSNTV